MRTYKDTIPLHGQAETALQLAWATLLALGFDVHKPAKYELTAKGPGMRSTRQPALLGVSRLKLSIHQQSLMVEYQLGGLDFLKKFIYVFPPALALLLALVFSVVGLEVDWVHFSWLLPWPLLAPWLFRVQKQRSLRAVEELLHAIAQSG